VPLPAFWRCLSTRCSGFSGDLVVTGRWWRCCRGSDDEDEEGDDDLFCWGFEGLARSRGFFAAALIEHK